MIRRLMLSLIAGLLGMAFVIAADDPPADPEPPVRLKKKARPADAKENPPAEKEEPKEKPPEKKGQMEEEPPVPAEPEIDEQEVLNRVSRNMRTAEERLANKELGEGTRQLQRDIVEDLDKLINRLNQQQNNSDNQGGGQSGMQKQNQGGQQQAKSGGRRSSQKQTARGSQKQGLGGQQPRQGTQQASNSGQGAGNTPGAGNGGPQGENEVADAMIKVWGHLPETLRQEMNAYSRQDYMSKYSEVIKQYYSTVAEKGRKKGD